MELLYGCDDGVATITLNRPERRNAFTFPMVEEWAERLREAAADPDVRAILITGAGSAFCAGVDLGELSRVAPDPLAHKTMLTDKVHKVALALADTDKPVLAAINGDAVGAGLDMALMCDIRFAARSARLSEGYIKVGLVPGAGGCYYLPHLVGTARALELLLTGDFIDAVRAEEIGLVNRVHDDDRLRHEALAFARRLAQAPPVPLRMIKRAVYQSRCTDLRTSLDLISSHMAVAMSVRGDAETLAVTRTSRRAVEPGR